MTGPTPAPAATGELTRWIRELRPPKEILDPRVPVGFEIEEERSRSGSIDPTGTIFITNRECPFTCLMCDLWRHTTDFSVPEGAVDAQVEAALERMPEVRHVKLYNAGSFFDDRAVSPYDRTRIADRVAALETVIVESHPRLVDERAGSFREAAGTDVEVAMGLETVHPEILPRLNKGMTLGDFETATTELLDAGLHVRAFILLRPPFMTEEEGVEWAVRSIEFAFSIGVGCCSVIPTRPGNGALEALAAHGHFAPPSLGSLELVVEHGIALNRGRVFADLWDVERIIDCPSCAEARVERMRAMNLTQTAPDRVRCSCR